MAMTGTASGTSQNLVSRGAGTRGGHRRRAAAVAALLVLSMAACACGAETKSSSGESQGATTAAAATTAAPAATTAAAAATTAAPATTAAAASSRSSDTTAAAAATTAAPAGAKPMSPAPDHVSPPPPTTARPSQQQNPLKAGSTDDNANFGDFLTYLDDMKRDGVAFRALDPSDRTVIRVFGSDMLPASGRRVIIRQGQNEIASLTTTADGTARFHPHAYQTKSKGDFTARVEDTEITLQPGQTQRMILPNRMANQDRPKLDIQFLLDATGSMGDEIDQLKATIQSVSERLGNLPGGADIQLGLTSYRDIGDEYVTRNFGLTNNFDSFRQALDKTYANNGGDIPEAVDEAVATALNEPNWRNDAIKLVFLVADAGPHVDRQVQQPYTDSMRKAAERGIKIFPVASSNTDNAAEVTFRQLAQFTGARFVFLSYGAGGSSAAVGSESNIERVDYQELSLNDLIVRLVSEELSARTRQG